MSVPRGPAPNDAAPGGVTTTGADAHATFTGQDRQRCRERSAPVADLAAEVAAAIDRAIAADRPFEIDELGVPLAIYPAVQFDFVRDEDGGVIDAVPAALGTPAALPTPLDGWPPAQPRPQNCPPDFRLAAFMARTEPLVRAAEARFTNRAGTREHWVERRRMRVR